MDRAAVGQVVSNNEHEARRRVDAACSMIASAYRLYPLEPRQTIQSVRTAITMGAEEMALDLAEEADRA